MTEARGTRHTQNGIKYSSSFHKKKKKAKEEKNKKKSNILPGPPHGPSMQQAPRLPGHSDRQERSKAPFPGCFLERVLLLFSPGINQGKCVFTSGPSVILYKNPTFDICQRNELFVVLGVSSTQLCRPSSPKEIHISVLSFLKALKRDPVFLT